MRSENFAQLEGRLSCVEEIWMIGSNIRTCRPASKLMSYVHEVLKSTRPSRMLDMTAATNLPRKRLSLQKTGLHVSRPVEEASKLRCGQVEGRETSGEVLLAESLIIIISDDHERLEKLSQANAET